MKKEASLLCLAFSVGLLAGCHHHNFDVDWTGVKEGHYHVCECGSHDKLQSHTFGKWYTKKEATREKTGVAARKCSVCNYEETKSIAKLIYKAINIYVDGVFVEEVRSDSEGNYVLEIPEESEGNYFAGYFDSSDNPFPLFGNITNDVDVNLHMTATPFDISNEASLDRALKAGVTTATVSADVTITKPHYVLSSVNFLATTDVSFIRSEEFGGDMFVVGIDQDYNTVATEGHVVEFTLNGGGNNFSILGNKSVIYADVDNPTTLVDGSAFFVAGLSTLNLGSNVVVSGHKKVDNARVMPYNKDKDNPENNGAIPKITNAVKVGGAAIISIDSAININGASFSNNEVNDSSSSDKLSSYGGAIFSSGPINIVDGTFSSNVGSYGAAIYSLRQTRVTQALFTDNHSYNYGTIYAADSQYSNVFLNAENFGDIRFEGNVSDSSGGALFVAYSATVSGTNVSFLNNQAQSSNGGAIASKGIVSLTSCRFEGNSSESKGGAVYVYQAYDQDLDDGETLANRSATFNACEFISNTSRRGSAVSLYASFEGDDPADYTELEVFSTVNFENGCLFQNNSATKDGSSKYGHGTIHVDKGQHLNIANSTIKNNTAEKWGAALYVTGQSLVNITNSVIRGNTASSNGGAMYINEKANVNIAGTEFANNTGTGGGAIYIVDEQPSDEHTSLTMESCTLSYNTASTGNGGALYVYTSAYVCLKGIICDHNTAPASGKFGGFMYQSGASTVEMYNVTSSYNSASQGGFVYITVKNSVLKIYSGSTTNCSATAASDANIFCNSDKAKVYVKGTTTGEYFGYDGTLFSGSGSVLEMPQE